MGKSTTTERPAASTRRTSPGHRLRDSVASGPADTPGAGDDPVAGGEFDPAGRDRPAEGGRAGPAVEPLRLPVGGGQQHELVGCPPAERPQPQGGAASVGCRRAGGGRGRGGVGTGRQGRGRVDRVAVASTHPAGSDADLGRHLGRELGRRRNPRKSDEKPTGRGRPRLPARRTPSPTTRPPPGPCQQDCPRPRR